MTLLRRNPDLFINKTNMTGYTLQTDDVLSSFWQAPIKIPGLLEVHLTFEENNDDDYRRTPFMQITQKSAVTFLGRPDIVVPNPVKLRNLIRVSDTDDELVHFETPRDLTRRDISGQTQRIVDFITPGLAKQIEVSHLKNID